MDTRYVSVTVDNSAEAVWLDRALNRMTQVQYAKRRGVPKWLPAEWETARRIVQRPVPDDLWFGHEYSLFVPMDIALRYQRWRRRMTQAELGALLGVSRQTINSWESLQSGWENLAACWGYTGATKTETTP